jgi:hypothetical protein
MIRQVGLRQSWRWLDLGVSLALLMTGGLARPVWALPGQSVREAEIWMRSNPTLQPGLQNGLMAQRTATPAERFAFAASIFPVGGTSELQHSGNIRTERFMLVDLINPITSERIEESLREIYGLAVFQDYRQATVLFRYPNPEAAGSATVNDPLLQGEVRAGERFAYWQEIAYNPDGVAQSGQMVVFLNEDLPGLRRRLLGSTSTGATP